MALIVFLVSLVCAGAWGPLSHFDFASRGLSAESGAGACRPYTAKEVALFVGSDLPDAFGFGDQQVGSRCRTDALALHDPIFAGYLYLAAKQHEHSARRDGFDLVSLSLGFSSHLIADTVGFNGGGYLGDAPTVNWVSEWPFMASIDSFIFMEAAADGPYANRCDSVAPLWTLPLDAAAFVANQTTRYHAVRPTFPVYTTDDVRGCTEQWTRPIGAVNYLSATTSVDDSARRLVFFDRYGAQTRDDVAAHIAMSRNCSVAALQQWMALIDSGATPEAARAQNRATIDQWKQQGRCFPR